MGESATCLAQRARDAIVEVVSDFECNSERYFTERDIVCRVVEVMRQKEPYHVAIDKNGCRHTLLHAEYPTPFKCDMNGTRFKAMPDDSSFRRGFYDLVILSPDFVRDHSYEVVNGQNFRKLRAAIRQRAWLRKPFILFAGEFMFARESLKLSRGADRERGIGNFVAKARQDYDKLDYSRRQRYVENIAMAVFIRRSHQEPDAVQELLDDKLRAVGPEVIPIYDHKPATGNKTPTHTV